MTDSFRNKPVIGVFVNNLLNDYTTGILHGMKTTIEEMKGMLICLVGGDLNDPYYNSKPKNAVYNLAHSRGVDGLIILSSTINTYTNKAQFEMFLHSFAPLPIVNVGNSIANYPYVTADNYHCMYKLVTHCIKEHGCRNIALIKGPENNEDAVTRFTAYKDALQKNNIPYNPDLVINGSFCSDDGRIAVIQFIDHRKTEFDALLCSNDYVAVVAIEELQRRGLRVPQDKIVTGYDDIGTCRQIYVPLTTVHQPCADMGRQAVRYLYALLRGNNTYENITLATQFIVRQSCGCKDHEAVREQGNRESISPGQRSYIADIALSIFKRNILNVTHFHEFEKYIFETLPQFGIKSCYLFINNGDNHTHTAKPPLLLIGYENYNTLNTAYHSSHFSFKEIIPFCTQRTTSQDIVYIYSLIQTKELLGVVLYIIDSMEKSNGVLPRYKTDCICELLTQELADAVKQITVRQNGVSHKHTSDFHEYGNGFNLSKTKVKKYFQNLITYMKAEKPYINEDLSLYDLARELKIPRNYLSYVINNNAGVTFYEFINGYRIKEAVRLLSNSKYNTLNILNVAYNSGFRAKSTFNKMFKIHTGMTPSDYRKKQITCTMNLAGTAE